MTAALEMQRTRPTRIKVAGIQTYPLTWVPAGHARALPLRPSRQRTPGIQTYPPGGTSPSTRPSTECRPSEAASPGFWTPFPAPFPTTSRHPRGRTLQHCKYPSNLVSGYENAASLVFLPCFSPADSQNALSQSEGRDVLGENKRILPPILSRGVALPSQIRQFGQTESNAFTRALFSQRRPAGGGHTIVVPDRSVPRLSPPDSGTLPRLHGLYNLPPPVACTWREDTVEGETPPHRIGSEG